MNTADIAAQIQNQAKIDSAFELEMLKSLCDLDAGTGIIEGNQQVILILTNFFSSLNIPFETVDAGEYGYHFVARIIPEEPKGKIILNAHIDTAFKRGDAKLNPVRTDDEGWLHGCGVSDCKGGVVISSNAVRICKELGLLPNYEIVMIYNCDEEIGSPSGQVLFQKEAKNASCVYAFEPSREEDGIITSRMGYGVCNLEIFGKQAHPAMFWKGASATECLIKIGSALYQAQQQLKGMYFNISEIESGPLDIMSPHAKASITFRINEDNLFDDTKSLLEEIFSNEYVKGCSIRYQIRELFPLMRHNSANIRMYEHMRDIGKNFMNWDLPEQGTYGAGDACFFSKYGLPSICGLGTYMDEPHTLNEKCKIESIERRTALMAMTLAFFSQSVLAG